MRFFNALLVLTILVIGTFMPFALAISNPTIQSTGVSTADSSHGPDTPPVQVTLQGQFRAWYTIYNPNPQSITVYLGLSIIDSGGQTWNSAVAHDDPCVLSAISATLCNRFFVVPATSATGTASVIFGVWKDLTFCSTCKYDGATKSSALTVYSSFSLGLSSRTTDGKSNVGTMWIGISGSGATYNLPSTVAVRSDHYVVQINPPGGYVIDHWETTGSIGLFDFRDGSAAIDVDANNGGITAVLKPGPDFSIGVGKSVLTVDPGGTDSTYVTVYSNNGFSGIVELNSGFDPGPIPDWVQSMGFSSNPLDVNVPSGGSAGGTFSITVRSNAPGGDYALIISGSTPGIGGLYRSKPLQLHVNRQQYTITVDTSPTGAGTPSGGGTYSQGQTITISVSNVDSNLYTLQKWQRDGQDYSPAGTSLSFQYQVDASRIFTAVFTPKTPLLGLLDLRIDSVQLDSNPPSDQRTYQISVDGTCPKDENGVQRTDCQVAAVVVYVKDSNTALNHNSYSITLTKNGNPYQISDPLLTDAKHSGQNEWNPAFIVQNGYPGRFEMPLEKGQYVLTVTCTGIGAFANKNAEIGVLVSYVTSKQATARYNLYKDLASAWRDPMRAELVSIIGFMTGVPTTLGDELQFTGETIIDFLAVTNPILGTLKDVYDVATMIRTTHDFQSEFQNYEQRRVDWDSMIDGGYGFEPDFFSSPTISPSAMMAFYETIGYLVWDNSYGGHYASGWFGSYADPMDSALIFAPPLRSRSPYTAYSWIFVSTELGAIGWEYYKISGDLDALNSAGLADAKQRMTDLKTLLTYAKWIPGQMHMVSSVSQWQSGNYYPDLAGITGALVSADISLFGVQIPPPSQQHPLSIVVSGDGGTTDPAPGVSQKNAGDAISISYSLSGASFSGWIVTGGVSCSGGSMSNPCTFNMPGSPVSVIANFNPPNQYQLTIYAGAGGTTNPPPGTSLHYAGDPMSISYSITSTGYSFAGWTVSGGVSCLGSGSCDFNMPSGPVSVIANFNPPNQYAITLNTSPSGLDNPQGGGTYPQGTVITISVSDVDGYTFQKWQRGGSDYSTQKSFQYSVDASHTFTAIFLPIANIYVIAIIGAASSMVSDPQAVASEVSSVASSKGLTVQVISSYDQLDVFVRNPPSNIVVINAHGETVPMPASWGASWQPYYDQLAWDVSTHGWTLVSVAGHPLYWLITPTQPIPPSPGPAGLSRFLSSVGGDQTTISSNVACTLTADGSQSGAYFGLSFPSSQTFARAVDWKGTSPAVIFYEGVSKGASAVKLGNGYLVVIGLPDTASDQLKADMGVAFSRITGSIAHMIRFTAAYKAGPTFARNVYYVVDSGGQQLLGTFAASFDQTFSISYSSSIRVFVNVAGGSVFYEELYVDGAKVKYGYVGNNGLTYPGSAPYQVTFTVSPSSGGVIRFPWGDYSNGQTELMDLVDMPMTAVSNGPPFSSWGSSGGISLGSSTNNPTTVSVFGSGSITATFTSGFPPMPFGSTCSSVMAAPAKTVYFIFPDGNRAHPKPAGVGYASVTDWTALGYVYGMMDNMPQITALDTNSTYIDQTTGAPKIHNSVIVLFAGTLVNSAVHYYEENRIAPLWWSLEGSWSSGTLYYRARSGEVAASMPIQTVGGGSADMALYEAFMDANGNTVLIYSGFGWKATFASGLYFKTALSQGGNPAGLTDSWYFYSWTDMNGNGFVEYYEVNPTAASAASATQPRSYPTVTGSGGGESSSVSLQVDSASSFGSAASAMLNAQPNSVYFIFPDDNRAHPKPSGVGYASVSDWTALGYVYGSLANMPQITALDTNSTYIDQATGAPKLKNSIIVLFAGPLVNEAVHYYEQNRIAPLWWSLEGDWSTGTEYYRTRTGDVAASMSLKDLGAGSADMMLVEAFTDPNGNTVLIFSGFGWQGTFTSGFYMKTVLYGNLAGMTDSWYFYSWTDKNGNQFVEDYEVDPTPVSQGN